MNVYRTTQQRSGPCPMPACPRPLDKVGLYCNLHGKRLRRHGSLTCVSLKAPARKPYITAAASLLVGHTSAGLLHQVEELLASCRAYRGPQADVGCKGYTPKEKAKAILARIHQVHGAQASLKVMAAFLGTFSMPLPTSAPLYRKIQIARAIYGLCKSEKVTLFGKTTRQRISLQGWRIAVALYELLDTICWPVKESYASRIKTLAKKPPSERTNT